MPGRFEPYPYQVDAGASSSASNRSWSTVSTLQEAASDRLSTPVLLSGVDVTRGCPSTWLLTRARGCTEFTSFTGLLPTG